MLEVVIMADRISLGLDIGVASVGFSVLNIDQGKVVELGARLFNAKVAEVIKIVVVCVVLDDY